MKNLTLRFTILYIFQCIQFCHLSVIDLIIVSSRGLTSLFQPDIINNILATSLFANDNDISELEPDILNDFTKLKYLVLDDNYMLDFPVHSPFLQIPSLTKLRMEYCNVTQLNKETLTGLPRLESLSLATNKIRRIQADTFATNSVLKILNLKNNKNLDLNDSKIQIISESLESLDVSHCAVTAISKDTFSRLPNLENLNLENNQIIQIDNFVFERNFNLAKLNLMSNRLDNYPKDIYALEGLKTICLDDVMDSDLEKYYITKLIHCSVNVK